MIRHSSVDGVALRGLPRDLLPATVDMRCLSVVRSSDPAGHHVSEPLAPQAPREPQSSRRRVRRRILIAVSIAVGLVASFFIARPLEPYLESRYGIDPVVVLVLFIAAEVLFDLGLAMMLWFGGVRRLSWTAVRSFKVKKARVDWRNPGVSVGLLINRISWCVPFIYVIVAGWGSLPWVIIGLAAAEIAVTLWVGALVLGLVRQPRLRRRLARDEDEQ